MKYENIQNKCFIFKKIEKADNFWRAKSGAERGAKKEASYLNNSYIT
jgi:hypothetical protein